MGQIKPFTLFFNIGGVDQRRGDFSVDPRYAADIQHMHVEKFGQWSAYQQGYSNINSSAFESGAVIDSLGTHTSYTGQQYLLAVVNGEIKSIDIETGAVIEDVKTGLTLGDKVDFMTMQGSCYMTAEEMVVQKWSGSGPSADAPWTAAPIGGTSYTRAKYIAQLNNRAVYLNFKEDAAAFNSTVLISDDLDPDTVTITLGTESNGAIIEVSPGDGQEITGAKTIRIPNSNDTALLVFKDRSVHIIEGQLQSEFFVTKVNDTAGAVNNNAIVQVGNDVIFLGENNIYSFSGSAQSGTLQPVAIGSDLVLDTLRSMNLTYKKSAWGVHLPWRNEVWFCFPTASSTIPDTIIVYRYPRAKGEVPVFSIKKNMKTICATVLVDRLYTGDNFGFIGEWFTASKHGDSAINWSYKYPRYDFGDFEKNKTLHDLKLYFYARENEDITVTVEWFGGPGATKSVTTKTIIFPASVGLYGNMPPAAIYGSSIYSSGAVLGMISLKPPGIGQQLQVRVNGTSNDTGVVFLGMSGLVEMLDQRRGYFY